MSSATLRFLQLAWIPTAGAAPNNSQAVPLNCLGFFGPRPRGGVSLFLHS
jgi:hypothetical protein